ncbi:MAG TPA: hypothetical protein PK044_02565 [Exilispira sp.]|nr:hypothetical protein [Exilispira sp.]HQJ40525.1 hypothetical protein [Exilispira sp.]
MKSILSNIISYQDCFIVFYKRGPRQITGSVSSFSSKFIDIISIPVLLEAGYTRVQLI